MLKCPDINLLIYYFFNPMPKIGRNDTCHCGSGKKYKKCCIDRDNRKVCETLKKFFGEEWIEQEIDKVKLDGYHNTNPMNLARMDIHPLIKEIVSTQIKLRQSESTEKTPVAIGMAETLQRLLHENLTILEPDLDLADIQRRLRDKIEFLKAEYELAIAAGYKRMGNIIEIIPRSAQKRTGEFYVTDTHGNKVLIECKKKDMISLKEKQINAWWEEFQHLMMQKLKSVKKPYGVAIYIPLDPERAETHLTVDEIAKIVLNNQEGENAVINGKYKIVLKKFCEIGGTAKPDQVDLFGKDADFGVSVAMQDKSAWPIGNELPTELRNPMKVSGYGPSDFLEERISSIISTLGEAYGQLDEDNPNIVYIDINVASMMPERSGNLMLRLPFAIKQKIDRDYSKISAVVLTNLKLLGHAQISGFHADEHIIRNAKAQKSLPPTFQVYGDIRNGKSILEDMKNILAR